MKSPEFLIRLLIAFLVLFLLGSANAAPVGFGAPCAGTRADGYGFVNGHAEMLPTRLVAPGRFPEKSFATLLSSLWAQLVETRRAAAVLFLQHVRTAMGVEAGNFVEDRLFQREQLAL